MATKKVKVLDSNQNTMFKSKCNIQIKVLSKYNQALIANVTWNNIGRKKIFKSIKYTWGIAHDGKMCIIYRALVSTGLQVP